MRWIVEGRQIVLKARSYPTPGIVQRFLDIGNQLITQWAEGAVNFSPNPEPVALMRMGYALIDQPGIERNRR
jgi:hypothetical protein